MDTDRAASDFAAIQHDVVGVGEGVARVILKSIGELRLRRRERMVYRRPSTVAVRLEHRSVDDPDELPAADVDQAAAQSDLEPRRAKQRLRLPRLAGREEDCVTRARTGRLSKAGPFGVGEVLRDRATELTALLDQHIGESPRAARFGPVLPAV